MSTSGNEWADAEAHGYALMAEGANRLVEGVGRLGAVWVVSAVNRVLDAWGRLDSAARVRATAAATTAGDRGTERVVGELQRLFALDAAEQRATPLEVIRSLAREASMVLREAGIPEVARDPFESRAFPDDVYGLVLKSPAELGDDELGGALLGWGMGKAKVLRARADRAAGRDETPR